MAGGKRQKVTKTSNLIPRSEPTRLAINSWEDVANSEDEFQLSRDRILLEEEPKARKRRKIDEEYEELLPSDEDILDLPSSEDEETEEEEYSDDGGQDDLNHDAHQSEEELEADEAWGSSRRDYYEADPMETEADALEEEQEAKRLQQKQLSTITEADLGLNDIDWLEDGKDETDTGTQRGYLEYEISEDTSSQERTRILNLMFPEFQSLGKEFVQLEKQYDELTAKAQAFIDYASSTDYTAPTPGSVVKWRALSAYLGALSMYFVLLTNPAAENTGSLRKSHPFNPRTHPIMASILRARTQWEKVRNLELPDPSLAVEVMPNTGPKVDAELTINGDADAVNNMGKKSKMSKAATRAVAAEQAAEEKRTARMLQTKANLAHVAASLPKQFVKSKPQRKEIDGSDFGDIAAVNAPRDQRKKTLAFYTSQIASKTSKRNLASQGAGGDDDIPHKERFRDKVARLNAEAQARGQRSKDALNVAPDEQETRTTENIQLDAEDENYYQLIVSRNQKKKADKVTRAVAPKEAAARGARLHKVEEIGPDGKRAITYAIEKNKGLTPKRKKEVRNPRVKKRMKYEEKLKKLGNAQKVYKPGDRGPYRGELSGINTGIVRSQRLD